MGSSFHQGTYQHVFMLYLNIWLTVKDPAHVDEVRNLLIQQATMSRTEPGCARFEVYQSNNDPMRFLLHERWESQAALDQHRTATAYTTVYHPKVLPLVNREPHPSTLVSE
ncbi:MAG: antibiotic biosynthesis monooxygenase [Pirellulales bacterium]|nr:antibiotic biosynthesis monooxygenase [Pirellulales bacterium]